MLGCLREIKSSADAPRGLFILTSLCLELPLPLSVLLGLDRLHVLQYLQGPRKQPEGSGEGSWHTQFEVEQLGMVGGGCPPCPAPTGTALKSETAHPFPHESSQLNAPFH